MSTLTILQKNTLHRGTIGQLDRSETSVITLRIRGYGSPMELQSYVQNVLQSAEDVVQVDPVNAIAPGDFHNLKRRYEETVARIQYLEEDFSEAVEDAVQTRLSDLAPFPETSGKGFGEGVHEEPVYLTVDEVVRKTGINYHTATRYLREGFWNGEKVRNQWKIPANQAFARKR